MNQGNAIDSLALRARKEVKAALSSRLDGAASGPCQPLAELNFGMNFDRSRETTRQIDWVFVGVLGCFVLSGFAALLYQIAWMRQFSFVFGTSELAVATVLASYMGGLAAGSALASRFVSVVRRPIVVYGLLELGVALGALAVPLALTSIRHWHVAWLGGNPEPPHSGGMSTALFYLFCAFALLAVPTACMGATLPMLTRHAVRRRDQIGSRVGVLYTMNTLGAVLGTLAAAFLLLPALGLWRTLVIGAAINVIVFVLAVAISMATSRESAEETSEESTGKAEPDESTTANDAPVEDSTGLLDPAWVLPMMLVSGAVAFGYEVVWTRLLAFILGGTLSAFAIMLSTFLIGIALGSAIASVLAKNRDRSAKAMVIAQLGTALLSVAIYLLLDGFVAGRVARYLVFSALDLTAMSLIAAMVLLPATICIGSTFPFAVRILARDESDAARAAARVYAWNTVGAIGGAVLAGFFLLPTLKFENTVKLAVSLNLVLALGACCLRVKPMRAQLITTAAIAVATVWLFQPGPPMNLIKVLALPGSQGDVDNPTSPGELIYYDVGRSATLAMYEHPNGIFMLRANGLPEAHINSRGDRPEIGRTMTVLPMLQKPDARQMLFIGLGGGSIVAGAGPSVESIDVIELEPKVVDANETVRDVRYPRDPLADERVNIILNDARSALEMTDKKYDVIISQPSHPWTAGASHLFTKEFFQLVHQHLEKGGVYMQWMNAEFVDQPLFKSLGNTLLDEFEYVEMYQPIRNLLLFLAANEPVEPERAFSETGYVRQEVREAYQRLGIYHASDIVAWLTLDTQRLRDMCGDAPICTDDRNIIATRSRPNLAEALSINSTGIFGSHDPLLQEDVRRQLEEHVPILWDYVVRRLIAMGHSPRAEDLCNDFKDEKNWALGMAWRVPAQEKPKFLNRVLKLDPDNEAARYALLVGYRDLVAQNKTPDQLTEHANKLVGPTTSVVAAWNLEFREAWNRIAEIDDQLAEVPATSIGFAEAVRLRAKWRVKLAEGAGDGEEDQRTAAEKTQLAEEALEILDIGWRADPIILEEGIPLRLDAARLADRPFFFLETARTMARLLRTDNLIESPDKLREHRVIFSDLATQVEKLEQDDRVPKRRVQDVVAQLDKRLGELGYFVGELSQ